jgi:hypothetical protein
MIAKMKSLKDKLSGQAEKPKVEKTPKKVEKLNKPNNTK